MDTDELEDEIYELESEVESLKSKIDDLEYEKEELEDELGEAKSMNPEWLEHHPRVSHMTAGDISDLNTLIVKFCKERNIPTEEFD